MQVRHTIPLGIVIFLVCIIYYKNSDSEWFVILSDGQQVLQKEA